MNRAMRRAGYVDPTDAKKGLLLVLFYGFFTGEDLHGSMLQRTKDLSEALNLTPFEIADMVRESAEVAGVEPCRFIYRVELEEHEQNPEAYVPFRNAWWKGFLPAELQQAREWLIEDGLIPEPTIEVERALSPLRIRPFFRWALRPFLFRPESRVGALLARIRPHLGGSATFNGRRGHWRNQWYPSLQEHRLIFIEEIRPEERR